MFIGSKKIEKPGLKFSLDSEIIIKKRKDSTWVSRGGYKLDHAISYFNLNCNDAVALDIGSSTGGFTHVLLTKGVRKVYCVDVGYGQLDWEIRKNHKVIVHEKTNARYLDEKIIKQELDIIVCDTSFISIKKVLPASLPFLRKKGWIIALIKPQFEIGKDLVGKGGVVRNNDHHQLVIEDIKNWFIEKNLFFVEGVVESPLLGPKGNK